MIFSHVLYQLSYLAPTKTPPEPTRARAGSLRRGPCYRRLSGPARHRGLHVSATVQNIDCCKAVSQSPYVGNAALRRRFTST